MVEEGWRWSWRVVLGAELLPETDAPEMDFKAVVEKGVGSSKRREGRKRGSDQRGRGSGRRSGGEVGGDVRSGGGICSRGGGRRV